MKINGIPQKVNQTSSTNKDNTDFEFEDISELETEAIKQALSQMLTSQEFSLYKAFYEEKLTIQELAEKEGVSNGNLKGKLFRLRTKVRRIVQRKLPAVEGSK